MYAAGIDTEAGFADIIGGAGASGEAGVIEDGEDYVF